MRNRKITLLLLAVALGVGMTFYSTNQKRQPASSQRWRPLPIGKHLSAFQIEIQAQVPESSDDEATILARVRVMQNLEGDLRYQWNLPLEVDVVEGQIEDSFAVPGAGQIVELPLKLRGFSKEGQKTLSLDVEGYQKDQTVGGSAVVVSRSEDTLEAVAPELKRSAEEQLGPVAPHRGRK